MVVRRALLLCLLALLAAAPAAEARRSVPRGFHGVFWGGEVRTATSQRTQDAQWSAMARNGVESVRTVFSWARAQPSGPGASDFSETDGIMRRAVRANIRVLPVVIDTPRWARESPIEAAPPEFDGYYTDYLRDLVGRYGPSGSFWVDNPRLPRRPLREYQIWNEPELRTYWNAEDWPGGYTSLLQASYRTIKAADPGAKVVLASLADYAWRHIAELYPRGIRGYFDVAAINFFTSHPRFVVRGVSHFRRALRTGGNSRTPIYVTETTFPASKGRNRGKRRVAWQRDWETTDRGMASRLRETYVRFARSRRSLGVGRVYWYTWASSYSPPSLFEYAGLLRPRRGRYVANPALRAFRESARRYQGCAKRSSGRCR